MKERRHEMQNRMTRGTVFPGPPDLNEHPVTSLLQTKDETKCSQPPSKPTFGATLPPSPTPPSFSLTQSLPEVADLEDELVEAAPLPLCRPCFAGEKIGNFAGPIPHGPAIRADRARAPTDSFRLRPIRFGLLP